MRERDLIRSIRVERLGVLMTPAEGVSGEAGGVLNPAVMRHHDGTLYFFPRLVAEDKQSQIGFARELISAEGTSIGTERLGFALQPEADYELGDDGRGGCEDPRIVFCKPLGCYTMTYVALSRRGPRAAFAVSVDLRNWYRQGLVEFNEQGGLPFADRDNKDVCFFPQLVAGPSGAPSIALLHRPHFQEAERDQPPGIWISYAASRTADKSGVGPFSQHRLLARPEQPWECLKIGAGTPPILTRLGWLIVYHGVGGRDEDGSRIYSAGLMLLDADDPCRIVYRSAEPILRPDLPEEISGICTNFVFPTGIVDRPDLGDLVFDIYYGMADTCIGASRISLEN